MNPDYLKLAKVLKANDTPTLDSNESTRVSVYITDETVDTLFNIMNINENLSIKKIFDQSSTVLTDQLTSDKFISFLRNEQENSLMYTTSFTYIFLSELNKDREFSKKRKTFVMSKRTEKFFRILAESYSVSIDSCIDGVISTYSKFANLSDINLCKVTRLFLQEIWELYYVVESLSQHPFIVNVSPFVSSSPSSIVNEILFDQIGALDENLKKLTGRAFSNNKEIENMEDKDEDITDGVLVHKFNFKSSYGLDRYDFVDSGDDNEKN